MNRNDRAVTAFAMLGHAMFHATELAIPIFVAIWLDFFPVTPAILGVIVGASYALIGLGALPSGLLADRVSSRRLVIVSLLGMGTAFVLLAAAGTLPGLAVALVLWGLSASIYHPAGLALLSRGTTARGTAFAYHGVAGNVGVALGPLLAAVLLVVFSWRAVSLALVLPIGVAVLLATQLEFDETAGSDGRGRRIGDEHRPIDTLDDFLDGTRHLFAGGFAIVFAIGILYGVYYRGTLTFLPEVLAGLAVFDPISLGPDTIEPSRYVYSGLLLIGGVGQYVGGRLVDRIPVETALVSVYGTFVVVALGFVPLANAGFLWLLVVSGVLGFLLFASAPINQEAISVYSPAGARGLSFGYSYAAVFGVGALGAWLAGTILTHSTTGVLFLVLAGLGGGAVLLAAFLFRHRRSDRRVGSPTVPGE